MAIKFRSYWQSDFQYFHSVFLPIILLFLVSLLGACVSRPDPAPVVERQLRHYSKAAGNIGEDDVGRKIYVVQKGDTLYSIALRYGLDANQLAEINNIVDPSELRIGQAIDLYTSSREELISSREELQPALFSIPQSESTSAIGQRFDVFSVDEEPPGSLKTEPKGVILPYSDTTLNRLENQTGTISSSKVSGKSSKVDKVSSIKESSESDKGAISRSVNKGGINWGWPAEGQVVSRFSERSKGMGITGVLKQPVLASAPGEVVYSGNGLRGYGNLVIIKHNDTYLSAYGHNSRVLVREGEKVSRGQQIAEMGNTDGGIVKLHFEIREKGKPVDPLAFLPVR